MPEAIEKKKPSSKTCAQTRSQRPNRGVQTESTNPSPVPAIDINPEMIVNGMARRSTRCWLVRWSLGTFDGRDGPGCRNNSPMFAMKSTAPMVANRCPVISIASIR